MMIENTKKQVYKVFDKYDKNHSKKGVLANLESWEDNKGWLINLLRRHPNWCENELSIIFNLTHKREIHKADIDLYKYELELLIHESELSEDEQSHCDQSLSAVAYTYSKILPDEGTAFIVKEYSGVSCSAGQKSSRVINAICKKYGLDKHPQYNARFAKLADALNPLYIERTALLSVHPCAYLEMADRDNSWHSCQCLDDGDYLGGTLSYMNDECSMIFYTVDQDITENFHASPKRTRQVFCFHDGMLLQSRLYPETDNDEIRDMYRHIVQKAISECMSVPNLWSLKRHHDDVKSRIITHKYSLHYRDYEYDEYKPNISLLKSTHGNTGDPLFIGHTAYCIDCSDPISDPASLYCKFCVDEEYVYCESCNERIRTENANYIDEVPYCDDCCSLCGLCKYFTIKETIKVYGPRNHQYFVCPECLEEYYCYCPTCDSHCLKEEGHLLDETFYCKICFDEYEGCNKYILDKESDEFDDDVHCSVCADEARFEEEKNQVFLHSA